MSVAPGSGPRHLTFHPTLSVVACHYDASTGELVPTPPLEVVPGVPTGQDGQTFCAAIRITGTAGSAAWEV
eukprot:Skav200550  [mRNA]  locus=scaffold676:543555:544966:- [translate_table: standard]